METPRPATRAPPPAYNTISRVTRGRSMRGVVLLCTLGGFIWSLVAGISYIREMGDAGLSTRLKTVYLVQGILLFVLAALEPVGFYAAWQQKLHAGKLYVFATLFGGVLVTVTETLRVALHFAFKSDILSACETQNAGDTVDFSSSADIADYCNDDWSNGIWRDAAWLVFGLICSVFMYILSRAYYHQLLDPNFGRTAGPASDRYRMDQMNGAPYGQDPPFVPPYQSGMANNDQSAYAPPPVYDAPAYAPPEKGGFLASDVKVAPEGEDVHDKDLAGQVHHVNDYGRSDSDVALPGRQGEGRV